ncbi:hypothetical protein WN944_029372 [Citrus x changshan-huyou]|uniref:Retrotransposon Copia-like N-terminal domain-containing protein n=1 Tax=Citrus x changshan-huyou TaxID=2935761 RepID=A0AAP0QA98_9ROSI
MSYSSPSQASSSSLPSNITNSVNIRLDRSNYPLWLAKILPLLRSSNLQKYVDGTSICPAFFLKDENGEYPYPYGSTVVIKATRGGPNSRGGRGFSHNNGGRGGGVNNFSRGFNGGNDFTGWSSKIEGYCQL